MHRVLPFFTREFHYLVGKYITTDDVITFVFSWIKCIFTHVASIYANLLEQKKAIYMRKELNSQRIVLVHQHGRRFIVLEHQYGRRDVMWKRSIERINLLLPLRENWAELTFAKTSGTVISDRKTNWPLAHWRVPSNDARKNCGTHLGSSFLSFINCRMSTAFSSAPFNM